MPRHSVRGAGGTVADQDHVAEPAGARMLRAPPVRTSCVPCAQTRGQLFAQAPRACTNSGTGRSFSCPAHFQVIRIVTDEPRRDLLRRPALPHSLQSNLSLRHKANSDRDGREALPVASSGGSPEPGGDLEVRPWRE